MRTNLGRLMGHFLTCLALATAGEASASTGPWCGSRPNILLILLDDFGWSSLPYLNPPIQWPGDAVGAGDIAPYRALQSPTYNRLDARLCADEAAPESGSDLTRASVGSCEGEGFNVRAIAADDEDGVASASPDYSQACEMDASDDVIQGCADHAHEDILPFRGGIQRIAEQGTSFTAMYAASSKCLPSRAAMISGMHGAETEATDNGKSQRLPRNHPTFIKFLQEQDYYTGLVGKWHASGRPTDPFGGKENGPTRDTCGDGFDEAIFYDSAYRGYQSRMPLECGCCTEFQEPGWSCPCSEVGNGGEDAVWSYYSYTEERKPDYPYVYGEPRPPKGFGKPDNCWDAADEPTYLAGLELEIFENGNPTSIQKIGCNHSVRYYADLAMDFIDRRPVDPDPEDSEIEADPFFLMVAFTAVHDGHRAPARTRLHYGTKSPDGVPLKNTGRGPNYWALMEEVDASIGRILAHLDAEELADNTLVILTSDQGPDGQRLLFGNPMLEGAKGNVLQAGIRVPMLVRACGQDVSQRVNSLASNVDLFRTIAHFAGVSGALPSSYPSVEGYDLHALMNNEIASLGSPPTPRDFVFSQYGDDEVAVVSRPGAFNGTDRPAFLGACGYLNTGDFGVVRGRVKVRDDLHSCMPDTDDAACAATDCQITGRRCAAPAWNSSIPVEDRPRCMTSQDCGDQWGDCEDEKIVDCNKCLATSWKMRTGVTLAKTDLYELSTDPEETLNLGESTDTNVQDVRDYLKDDILYRFLNGITSKGKGCDRPGECGY